MLWSLVTVDHAVRCGGWCVADAVAAADAACILRSYAVVDLDRRDGFSTAQKVFFS